MELQRTIIVRGDNNDPSEILERLMLDFSEGSISHDAIVSIGPLNYLQVSDPVTNLSYFVLNVSFIQPDQRNRILDQIRDGLEARERALLYEFHNQSRGISGFCFYNKSRSRPPN